MLKKGWGVLVMQMPCCKFSSTRHSTPSLNDRKLMIPGRDQRGALSQQRFRKGTSVPCPVPRLSLRCCLRRRANYPHRLIATRPTLLDFISCTVYEVQNHGLSHNEPHTPPHTLITAYITSNTPANTAPLTSSSPPTTTTAANIPKTPIARIQHAHRLSPENHSTVLLGLSPSQIPTLPLFTIFRLGVKIARMEPRLLLHNHLHPDRVAGDSDDCAEE